ncbi:MAG: InlB B-repeat-containing protein [Clostridia bacterium]|nr:InlB B-repeat-containing protein [Clostridia bacterium]
MINEGGTVLTTPTPVPASGEKKLYESTQQATLSGSADSVQSVTLPQFGMVELTASGSGSAQWQIQVPGTQLWVNIAGETSATISLTYAKISSMLSGGAANLRCAFGSTYSATARVTVSYGAAETEAEAEVEAPAVQAFTTFALQRPSSSVSTYNVSAQSDEDAKTTYNVVVNYVSENGTIVADPYTANLAAGTSFSATVTFPTVLGYLPYLNEEQKNSLELNIAGIDKDYTYNVVYKPTNVDYTVIHYQQNLNDDNYIEKERETKQGLTNSTVPEVANTYAGFYALLYEKPAIAADGSTVVEVYYDRYYYLMNFDLDGGYGVEPIYARYGALIGDVGTPTKAGYSFAGWTLDGTNIVELPEKMPAENRTYKAVWKADNTAKVTVVFWGENADDEEYSYIKSAQVNVKPGTKFTYSEDGSLICALEVHTHSESCYTLTCTQEVHTHSKDCYTCGQTEHTTHTTTCYYGVGNKQNVYTGVPNNPANGQVVDHWRYGLLIYINGSWYRYSGSTAAGDIAPTTCHKHSDACFCDKTEHTHSVENGCYTLTCTKTEHNHTSDCYMNGAGLDSNLWKFVRSDTVTVAADGSSVVNVYYDRTEKTLTFKYNYSNRNGYKSTETITAKWGADISKQYVAIAKNAGSTFWSAETSGDGPYTNYFGVMPQTSATYYNRGTSGNNGTMTYWGQDLNGEYNVKLFEVTGVGGYTVTDEDRYAFEGFTYHHGTSNGSSCSGAAFYYTRNSYKLTFNDGYNDVRTESVLYEAPLSTYSSYVPDVPSAYETGSVTFGGWYLNPECTGEEYKLTEHTMPADNVLLYAKWVPKTHTVEFYLDKDEYEKGSSSITETHPTVEVDHGSKIDSVPETPKNGSYTFVGWFYMEDGVEKAFDFANMPVNKDLKVYGKWSSNVLKQYTIYYKIQGTDTEIADSTTGSGLAGITKTFDAKGGTDLYVIYQEGYFPVTKSHSLTLDINATTENDTNVFTFWYVQREAVPYTVKYLNAETLKPVANEKTVSNNRKAVVTETFVPVSGMMPDAYQKRLVVSAEEGAVNEIIFYYTEDTTHAYYKITHYTENLGTGADGKPTWTEYASSQAVGNINETYSADPMTIPGFTYDSTVEGTVVSGELTSAGLELKLYYTRNSYPYQVRYLEQGTGKQLAAPKDGTGKYGEVISESAKDIPNYTVVAPDSQTLNIRIEEGTEAKLNIITFYYTENEATINYEVVGPTGCGTVTPTSETLKVLSGTAQGSTAAVSSNLYRFVGWYTDETCTQAVNANWVDANNKLTPVKADGAAWTNTTYYAKFVEDQVTINYEVVGVGGTVSPDSEKVDVLTGKAQGSTATASENYHFVGWYTDAACTNLLSTGAKYVPTQPSHQDNGETVTDPWVDGTTYYAKFEENTATINYVVANNGVGGTLAIEGVVNGQTSISETLKVLSDSAKGSTATANTNYRFVGWYKDEACNTLVSENVSYTPEQDNGVWKDATYYAKFEEDQATINYVAVGPEGLDTNGKPNATTAGWVNPPSETLSVISGTAQGSTATASSATYKFVGWYKDAACTNVVTETDGTVNATTNEFVPLKTGEVWVNGTTYYAKFDYNLTTLTITKSGLMQTSTEDCESAIFKVTDASSNLVARVALQNGSVTIDGLTVGQTYTITEENEWAWRYTTVNTAKITLKAPPIENEVVVNNSQNNYKWLGGDNYKVNKFAASNSATGN